MCGLCVIIIKPISAGQEQRKIIVPMNTSNKRDNARVQCIIVMEKKNFFSLLRIARMQNISCSHDQEEDMVTINFFILIPQDVEKFPFHF